MTTDHSHPAHTAYDIGYPTELARREDQLIADRRKQAGNLPDDRARVGLALSGGGIRSATFSLGILQGLAKAGLLRRFDYLSTVSGGGYIGGFLGSLYARKDLPKACPTAPSRADEVEAILKNNNSPPLRWLRDNGRYLTPNGAGDALLAMAYALRNWLSVLVVMATLALTVFLFMDGIGILVSASGSYVKDWFSAPRTAALIWWSPWLILPLTTFLFWVLPTGWAYWLVTPSNRCQSASAKLVSCIPIITTLLIALVPFVICFYFIPTLKPIAGQPDVTWIAWTLASAAAAIPVLTLVQRMIAGSAASLAQSRLTKALSRALTITGILVAIALIDSFGLSLYSAWARDGIGPWLTAGLGGLLAAYAAVQRFASILVPSGGSRRPPPMMMLIGIGALLVHAAILVVLCAAAHGISWAGKTTPFTAKGQPTEHTITTPLTVVDGTVKAVITNNTINESTTDSGNLPNWEWTLYGFLTTFALTLSYAWVMSFVNNSALAKIYGARLTRSYLGAGNPKRIDHGIKVTDVLHSDDLESGLCHPTEGYHPEAKGGPLHFINITINETVDGRSELQQQDRKGMGLSIGPAGMSVGLRHHAYPSDIKLSDKPKTKHEKGEMTPCQSRQAHQVFTRPFFPEPLSLGQMIGISGAAFSTGLGAHTSISLSLLCGLFNVRTGYWWDHDQKGSLSRTVHDFLLHEWLGRFPGTAWRHWYLSDGGHFENLACYEFIRRRLPLIVCCDNGEDPQYAYEDIGILTRKARSDFGAEIRFLDRGEINETLGAPATGFVGTLDDLRPSAASAGEPVKSKSHAALARITYADGKTGLLLLIKPTLTGDEPEDVRHYQRANPAFPNEPTIDQFFDEAQWESYRKLGEVTAERLIRGGSLPALLSS